MRSKLDQKGAGEGCCGELTGFQQVNTGEGVDVGLSIKTILQPKDAAEVCGGRYIPENVVVVEGFVDIVERRIHGEHSDREIRKGQSYKSRYCEHCSRVKVGGGE